MEILEKNFTWIILLHWDIVTKAYLQIQEHICTHEHNKHF